ncbi:MAG: hypothetical protein HYW07_01070, partial [Candidatus Latescibacteria bacterium]|nr:hypothetical protein [Candidatus Latescibacterota bacterium]
MTPYGVLILGLLGYFTEVEQAQASTTSLASVARINRAQAGDVLPADFDGNGRVDFADFFLFADVFGSVNPLYDLDNSGRVDFADFFLFADDFGKESRREILGFISDRDG